MKHIDLTKPNIDGLAKFMVTQSGNNHGDQILELKELCTWVCEKGWTKTQYKTLATTVNFEGGWMDLKQMKAWMKAVVK